MSAPRGHYRYVRTSPLIFSYVDPHVLYLGSQMVLKTTDGGATWSEISPDLSRETDPLPASVAAYPGEAKARPRTAA